MKRSNAVKETWPNFFVVGAAKAGTTSIYSYLNSHDSVFMCPVKEPHFFATPWASPSSPTTPSPINDAAEYTALFARSSGYDAVGEASPSYLYDEEAPTRIRDRLPHAKIVIVLRDPVDRAFSHYLMDVREGVQRSSFKEALIEDYSRKEKGYGVSHLYVELGMYGEQIGRYLQTFPPEQLLILFFDDLVNREGQFLGSLCDFLGVRVDAVRPFNSMNTYKESRSFVSERLMASHRLRALTRRFASQRVRSIVKNKFLLRSAAKPPRDEEATRWLRHLYADDLSHLEDLLEMRLPMLRKSW